MNIKFQQIYNQYNNKAITNRVAEMNTSNSGDRFYLPYFDSLTGSLIEIRHPTSLLRLQSGKKNGCPSETHSYVALRGSAGFIFLLESQLTVAGGHVKGRITMLPRGVVRSPSYTCATESSDTPRARLGAMSIFMLR